MYVYKYMYLYLLHLLASKATTSKVNIFKLSLIGKIKNVVIGE